MSSTALKLGWQDFIDWWLDGLNVRSKHKQDVRYKALTIKPLESGFECQVWDKQQGSLTLLKKKLGNGRTNGLSELKAILPENVATVLFLPIESVLVREVSLPLSTRSNLREVLDYELDKLTPFQASDVTYNWHIVDTNKLTKKLTLLLVVVPTTFLQQKLSELSDLGLKPDIVSVADPRCRDHINLVTLQKQSVYRWTLPLLAMCMTLTALYLPLIKYHQQYEKQEQVLSVLRHQAKAISAKQAAWSEREQVDAELQRLKRQHQWLPVLNTLSSLLPSQSWIERMRVNELKVDIQGYSVAAARLIALLDESPLFHNVRFESPVTNDQRSGKQRFHITLELENRHDR